MRKTRYVEPEGLLLLLLLLLLTTCRVSRPPAPRRALRAGWQDGLDHRQPVRPRGGGGTAAGQWRKCECAQRGMWRVIGACPRPERGNGKGDPASRHARTTPAVLHHRRSGDAGGAHTPMNRLWFPLCTWELADLHVSAHQSFERSACAWCLCASPHRYVHMQPVHMCSCLFFLCAERCIGHVNVHVCCARV